MSRRILLAAVVVAVFSQVTMADLNLPAQAGTPGSFSGGVGLPERVLHFPPTRSVGKIVLLDESYVIPEISREFHPGYVFTPPQYVGPARGEVRIPAGKCACLHLGGKGVTRQQCFDVLKSLAPNDVQDLDFLQPLRVDDAFLPYVARLTGVTHFCPVIARFTGSGWSRLQSLPRLEHICTPYGLTDAEMAGIATLQMVNEMEMIATQMTDAGLASIAKMPNMRVLHLECIASVTDEGLKALATLPRLRHLAQIQSLERLTVPWLDRITEEAISYLKSMAKLKALGVGDAWSGDAGVASLASLTNLEVLALKGGANLTDNALKPLAGMPKLRALEIYHSRITEQGLAHLSSCKMLDSIQIQSNIPISQQAIARLKTELPNVQTLDVSQPETPRRSRPLATRQP